jgi:hypothetical protein
MMVNRDLALKLAHILVEYDVKETRMLSLLNGGYFNTLLSFVNSEG